MTQQEVENYLWGAAVALPGTIDTGDYKLKAGVCRVKRTLSLEANADHSTSIHNPQG